MDANKQILDLFHPLIGKWFTEKYDKPTDIQIQSWPVIATGKHVLITAPTGSGKTLTAFLWALNQLITGTWPVGGTRILYVSPLKALNNDIRRNLLSPMEELRAVFNKEGVLFPDIKVLTRSGDTPQSERQRMLRHPPEILITTPVSLNLILSSKKARNILIGLYTVILDEIHAVASSKRGTHLITAVDRLVRLSGEFQRISLSATVKPIEKIAEFIGGASMEFRNGRYYYEKRPVAIIQSKKAKQFDIRVRFPENAREQMKDDSWWPSLVNEFKKIIKNRSTLFFTNTRRLAEKITRLINEEENKEEFEQFAYSHHGSLSKEIRSVVEHRLKQGELKAIVATSSLELGIDIGELDEVVLIQTPFSVCSGLQRIGRAGHSVGQQSKGSIFPTHGQDFLNAAIMARSIMDQDIEEALPIVCPLDVLSQLIISMTGLEEWDIDELFASIKTSMPYYSLSRKQFDLVLEMLAGRYADSRIRELKPRVFIDRLDNKVRGKEGVLILLYHSGGTIPNRGYFDLRLRDGSKIGELDEEFVWERKVGDTFTLGTQTWKVVNIDSQKVEVVPCAGNLSSLPFWKAEKGNRDFHFFDKTGCFLEYWNSKLNSQEIIVELEQNYKMELTASKELIDFLKLQREITSADLPHRHHILIERNSGPLKQADSMSIILHTLWGGKVNKLLALILSAAWKEKYGQNIEVFADDECLMLLVPGDIDADKLFSIVTSSRVEDLIRKKIEKTGLFGARFRENAGTALLLPRSGFFKRMPLWLTRLRSKKLLDALLEYKDFPILVETWRCCLQDEFDLVSLKILLDELHRGEIRYTEVTTKTPSPFARGLVWRQTDKHMYTDDTPTGGNVSSLSGDILKEILYSTQLRPQIDPDLIKRFDKKLKRTAR